MKLTKLRLESIAWYDGSVRVEFNAKPSDELQELLSGEVDIEIVRHRKKRSLNANGYAWVLIDRLAEVLKRSQTEVYREAVKDIGGVSEYICIQSEAVERMRRMWESKGVGWQVEVLEGRTASRIDGCTNLKLTYGSSVYDTRQMSALIDHLVQDCQAVGIDTKTPDEIAELVRLWDEADKHI